jgi:hypothetical protein
MYVNLETILQSLTGPSCGLKYTEQACEACVVEIRRHHCKGVIAQMLHPLDYDY